MMKRKSNNTGVVEKEGTQKALEEVERIGFGLSITIFYVVVQRRGTGGVL